MIKSVEQPDDTLLLVDENDHPVAKAVEGQATFHRGVAVLVLNPKGDILLHRPVSDVGSAYLPWKSSCYGAVHMGEDYRACAVRVMKEFFGIEAHPFKFESLDYNRPTKDNGNRFIHGYMFRNMWPIEYIREVPAETTWFRPSDIQSAVVAKKMQLSPALSQTMKNYIRLQEYKRRKNSSLQTSLGADRHFRLIDS